MPRTLSGSIALTKLKHKVITLERKGPLPKKIRGIFIPIEENYLVAGKDDAFYMQVNVYIREHADQYGQHGFIAQKVDSKIYKEADAFAREEYNKLPILGNVKDFGDHPGDNSGQMHDQLETPDVGEDDLPF